ncbi:MULTISPECIES: hypothetical protein [Enterobacterales]|uniref:hypothetical protein n=1 Tax=Enterobacterales TaxID=91347 RepID=UPI0024AFEE19|nr:MULTISPECIES: hypothetical protein [Enterobacterales]MDI6958607.1 hypothetical protein [Pantoea sp. Pa-EAmG]MDI9223692.1 hypothetical protein [Pantoea sp. EA-12]MDI9265946.1 hypothetical protein [Serratia sp. PF2-63]MDI9267087.1 hypothetical protein [Serratia sp. PF-27]
MLRKTPQFPLSAEAFTSRRAFIRLIMTLLADTGEQSNDDRLTRALRLFFSKHGAYCGGYLLSELSRVTWLWEMDRADAKDEETGELFVEIDVRDNDLIDLTVILSLPDACVTYHPVIFDDRFTGRERAVYLNVQPLSTFRGTRSAIAAASC